MKTLAEKIEVMTACLDGKEIEMFCDLGVWVTRKTPFFNWKDIDYRIKPEPITIWVNIHNSTFNAHKSEARAKAVASSLTASERIAVKFVEVIE